MQGQSLSFSSLQQRLHGPLIQIAISIQTADDKSVGTQLTKPGDLGRHHGNFLGLIKKVAGPGAHQTADLNIAFCANLFQKLGIGSQSAYGQIAAKLQTVSTAGNGSPGRCQRVNTYFQNTSHH